MALLLTVLIGRVSATLVSVMTTSLAISTALLFCVLVLVYEAIGRAREGARRENSKMVRFLMEITSNISFAILLSIVSVLALLVVALLEGSVGTPSIDGGGSVRRQVFTVMVDIASAVVYFLVPSFFLTLLMLLKRMHVLLKMEADEAGTRP